MNIHYLPYERFSKFWCLLITYFMYISLYIFEFCIFCNILEVWIFFDDEFV